MYSISCFWGNKESLNCPYLLIYIMFRYWRKVCPAGKCVWRIHFPRKCCPAGQDTLSTLGLGVSPCKINHCTISVPSDTIMELTQWHNIHCFDKSSRSSKVVTAEELQDYMVFLLYTLTPDDYVCQSNQSCQLSNVAVCLFTIERSHVSYKMFRSITV